MHGIPPVLLAPLILAAPLCAQERQPEHLLRLSTTEGRETRYKVTIRMSVELQAGDTPIVQDVLLEFSLLARVRDVTEAGAAVVYRIERLVADYGTRDQRVTYDSAKDEKPQEELEELAGLLGKQMTDRLDERGRSTAREMAEEIARLDRTSGADFLTMSDMIAVCPPLLPEEPVAVGTKWRSEAAPTPAAAEKGLSFASEYELLSVEKGLARIRHDLRVHSSDDSDQQKAKHFRRAARTVTLDLGRGVVVREETAEEIRLRDGTSMDIERTVSVVKGDGKVGKDGK